MSNEYMNECEHFDNGYCDKFYDVMCYERSECKYKQIQQLKAENEELRNKNKVIHSIVDDLQKRNHYLTQEIEKLETALDEIKEQIEDIISEKCNKTCMECTGRPLCDKYYILRKIKEVTDNE